MVEPLKNSHSHLIKQIYQVGQLVLIQVLDDFFCSSLPLAGPSCLQGPVLFVCKKMERAELMNDHFLRNHLFIRGGLIFEFLAFIIIISVFLITCKDSIRWLTNVEVDDQFK